MDEKNNVVVLSTFVVAALAHTGAFAAATTLQSKTVTYQAVQVESKKFGRTVFEMLEPGDALSEFKVDLNGDGTKDKLWVPASSLYCGSGGCETEVLLSQGAGSFVVKNLGNTFVGESESINSSVNGTKITWKDQAGNVFMTVEAKSQGEKKSSGSNRSFLPLAGNIATYEGAGCLYQPVGAAFDGPILMADDYDYKGVVVNVSGKDELFLREKEGVDVFKSKAGTVSVKKIKAVNCGEGCSAFLVNLNFSTNSGEQFSTKATEACGD